MDYFDITLDARIKYRNKMNFRPTVRGLAFRAGLMLMIQTNRGDYKVPGGGVRQGEKQESALKREVLEETGYTCTGIQVKIGEVKEIKTDIFDHASDFCMHSFYYIIDVCDQPGRQKLDRYENDLGFEPCWISVGDAIAANSALYETRKDIGWLEREIEILKAIKKVIS